MNPSDKLGHILLQFAGIQDEEEEDEEEYDESRCSKS